MKQNITENQLKALNDVQLEKFMGIKVDKDKFYFEGFAQACGKR